MSYGKIDHIFMSLPIKSFLIGIPAPIEIQIEDIEIFLKTNSNWEFFDYTSFEFKSRLIKQITDNFIFRLKVNENPALNNTYLNRTISYLVDNISISLKNITIIFEDSYSNQMNNMLCGVKVEKISIENDTKKKGKKGVKKKFSISKLYMFVIPTKSKKEKLLFDYSTINPSENNFVKQYSDILYKEKETKDGSFTFIELKNYYIFSPISIELYFSHSDNQYDINLSLKNIDFIISNQQFKSICCVMNFIENYKQFYKNCFSLRKLNFYKPKERNILLFKHYIKGILYLIKEKKYNIPMFKLFKTNKEYKDIFIKQFKEYYYNNTLSNELKELIQYMEIREIEEWIKEDIKGIYYYNHVKKGFFGGLWGYFYSNTIDNLKIDEQEFDFSVNNNISFNATAEGVSLSLITHNQNEINKLVFKEINLCYNEESGLKSSIARIRLEYTNIIGKSNLRLPILKNSKDDNAKALIIEYKNNNLDASLISHYFIYNKSMLNSLLSYFTFREFDIYADKIFSLSNDMVIKDKKVKNISINILINNPQLILSDKTSKEKIIINLGDFHLLSDDSISFQLLINKSNIEFNKQNIIDNFSVNISSKNILKNVEINITKIKSNISLLSLEKICLILGEIKNYKNDKDIWMLQTKEKDVIYNNSIKRGFLLFKSNSDKEHWDKYYSLLSGGYIYLYSKSSDLNASYLIPMFFSSVSEVQNGNNNIYYFTVKNDDKKYNIGFINEKVVNDWKKLVKERIDELNCSYITDTTIIQSESKGTSHIDNLVKRKEKNKRLNLSLLKKIIYYISIYKGSDGMHKGEDNFINIGLCLKGIQIEITNEKDKEFLYDIVLDDIECLFIKNIIYTYFGGSVGEVDLFNQAKVHLVQTSNKNHLIQTKTFNCSMILYENSIYLGIHQETIQLLMSKLIKDKLLLKYVNEIKELSWEVNFMKNIKLLYQSIEYNKITDMIFEIMKILPKGKPKEAQENENMTNKSFSLIIKSNNITADLIDNKKVLYLYSIVIDSITISSIVNNNMSIIDILLGKIEFKKSPEIQIFYIQRSEHNFPLMIKVIDKEIDININSEIIFIYNKDEIFNLCKYFKENSYNIQSFSYNSNSKKQKEALTINLNSKGATLYFSCGGIKESIWYILTIKKFSIEKTNFISVSNIQITSYDNFKCLKELTIIYSNGNEKEIIISPISVCLRQKDYANLAMVIYSFISIIKLLYNNSSLLVKTSYNNSIIFNVNELSTELIIKDKYNLLLSLKKINASIVNQNQIRKTNIKIGNIVLKDNNSNLITTSINQKESFLHMNIINNKRKNDILYDINIKDLLYLIKYEIYYDVSKFFQIKQRNTFIKYNNVNYFKEQPTISSKKIAQSTEEPIIKLNFLISNNIFYLKSKEHLISLEANYFISIIIEKSLLISKQTTNIQIQNALISSSKYYDDSQLSKVSIKEHQKKILLTQTTILLNIAHSSYIEDSKFPINKTSLYLTSEKLKFKLSYNDIFILHSIISSLSDYFIQEPYMPLVYNIEESIYSPTPTSFTEIYYKGSSLEFSLINQKNSCNSPYISIGLTNTKFTTAITANQDTQIKLFTNIYINYFNAKSILWEPFIEPVYCDMVAKINDKNIQEFFLNLPRDLNINFTEEFLSCANDIYGNFEQINKDEIPMNVSNHILNNYSGEEICINETYIIKNGESFDLETIDFYSIASFRIGSDFNYTKVNLDNFAKEKLPNGLFFTMTIAYMKKNYIFYSHFIIESCCSNTVIINKTLFMNNGDIIGVGSEERGISIISNYDYQSENEVKLNAIKNLSLYKLDNLIINIEKKKLELWEHRTENIYKFKIYPNIIIQNCIDMPLSLYFQAIKEEIIINPCSNEQLHLTNRIINNFKLKYKYKGYEFTSDNIQIYPVQSKEKSVKINIPNGNFHFKINYIENNGVINMYIFFDYILINNTPFDIYPTETQFNFQYNFYGNILKYYPMNNFRNVNLVLNEGNGAIKEIETIYISKKNYAFFKEISVSINKKKRNIKLLVQRHLRYFKFTEINKIDILIISLIDNQNSNEVENNQISMTSSVITRTTSLKSITSISSRSNIIVNNPQTKKMLSHLTVNFKNINVNIIATNANERNELALLNINGLLAVYTKELVNKIDVFNSIELRIKNIQIDNMTKNPRYKVILGKVKDQVNIQDMIIQNPNSLFIYFKAEYKITNNKFSYDISKIEFFIQTFCIFLDSEISADAVHFYFKCQKILNTEAFYYGNILQVLPSLSQNFTVKYMDNSLTKPININLIKASKITIIFSYKNITNRLFDELTIKNRIIQNIIDLFAGEAHISINLNSLEMTKVSGNKNFIISKIKDYYYYNFIRQCIKLLFSIDILGNPLGLLERLGKGVKDFIYFPIRGVVNGPSEFLFGSFTGAKSLLWHLLGGLLDSGHKIMDGVGRNILKLTYSEEYLSQRNLVLYTSNHGLKKNSYLAGLNITYLGIKYGLRDFFYFPGFYYSNRGALYTPIGALMGVTSLVVKPVSGVMDLMSISLNRMAKRFLSSYEINFKKSNFKQIRNKRFLAIEGKQISYYNYEAEFYSSFMNMNLNDIYQRLNERGINSKENFYIKRLFIIKSKKTKNEKVIYKVIVFLYCNKDNYIIGYNAKKKEKFSINNANIFEYNFICNVKNIININNDINTKTVNILYINRSYRNRFNSLSFTFVSSQINLAFYAYLKSIYENK